MNEIIDRELKMLDELQNGLIIELFQTVDKRYAIRKALREAYVRGRKYNG